MKALWCSASVLTALWSMIGTPGITGHISALSLASGAILFAVTGWRLGHGERDVTLSKPALLVLGLLLWTCVCSLWSPNAWESGFSLLSLTAATGVCLFQAQVSEPFARRLCQWLLLIGLTGVNLYGWARYRLMSDDLPRLQGHFTNPDSFALVGLLGFCLSGVLWDSSKRWAPLILGASSLIHLLSLLATQSRSAMVGAFAALVLVASLSRRRGNHELRSSVGWTAAMLLVLASFLLLSSLWSHSFERWNRLTVGSIDITIRQQLVEGSLHSFLENPLTGSGPGGFTQAFRRHIPEEMSTQEYANAAHNDYLQWLVETGLPGVLFWLALHLLILKALLSPSYPLDSERAWLAGALVGFLAYSLFNFVTSVPTTLLLWYVTLGLSMATLQERHYSTPIPFSARQGLAAALVMSGLFTTTFAVRCWIAEQQVSEAHKAEDELKWVEAYRHLTQACQMVPTHPEYRIARASLGESLGVLTGEPAWFERAARDLAQAAESNPTSLDVALWRYRFHMRRGDKDKALAVSESARTFAPRNRHLARYKAGALVYQGELLEAARVLARIGGAPELPEMLAEVEREQPGATAEVFQAMPTSHALGTLDTTIEVACRLKLADVVTRLYDHRKLLAPQTADIVVRQALDLATAGGEEQAKASLRELLSRQDALAPETREAALVTLAQLDGPSARSELQRYLEGHPAAGTVRVALSDLTPDSKQAITLLTKGLDYNPNDIDVLKKLGDRYEKLGIDNISQDYYERAASLSPQASSERSTKIEERHPE